MPAPRHVLVLTLLFVPSPTSQNGAVAQTATALPARWALAYNVEWRLIDAGNARLSWAASTQPSRPGWRVNLHLESTGLVSKLYKVNDDYAADLGPELCVQDTHLSAHEGSRQRETVVHYDSQAKRASYLEQDAATHALVLAKETDIPRCVHDVIGGLMLLRTFSLEPGRSIEVPVSDGKKIVSAKVGAQQREQVKVPAGTFKTIRYEAFLFDNVLYRRPGHLYVWFTDDARRVPVRLQVRLRFTIGTITFQLEKEEKT